MNKMAGRSIKEPISDDTGPDTPTGKQSFTPKTRSSTILQAVGLWKEYQSDAGRVVALRDINFIVHKGEFVSIIGPSGCGKSTLLNMVGALDKPTSGKVYIDGIDIFSLQDHDLAVMRNRLIGFIFQSYNLINRTTVLENVEIPAIISETDHSQRRRRAEALLKLLGIGDKAHMKPPMLSGGQIQRVAIARALMNNPAIILADEPTGNLDTKTGLEVFELLQMLSNRHGRTIVMVTHNPELAVLTDRSIYLRDGRIEREVSHNAGRNEAA